MIPNPNKEYKYEIILYWSYTERCYVAEVPELEGCFSYGQSQLEAFDGIQKAIALWVRKAQEIGMLIPQPAGRLDLKDDIYSFDSRKQGFLQNRWVRTKE